jgi:hypothetical protein
MGRTPGTDIGRGAYVPLATGAEHEEEGICGFPSISAGTMALVGTMQRRFHAFPDQGTNPEAQRDDEENEEKMFGHRK